MSRNVVVVGGGIAGLAAAIYLARGGRTVTVFEKRRHLGGRAVTHLRHGFRFNLGPHAFFRAGHGAQVLRDLGIPIRGGSPRGAGLILDGDERYRFPADFFALLLTGLLGTRAKLETAKLMFLFRRMKRFPEPGMPFRAWLDANTSSAEVRRLVVAIARLASYSAAPEELSAALTLQQLRLALRGVIYIDEGWQKIVDGLHSAAVSSGVNFVTSSRIVALDHDGTRVRGVSLGGLDDDEESEESPGRAQQPFSTEAGTKLPADTVVLAIDPISARSMLHEASWMPTELRPIVMSCLDVALSKLPDPKKTFALGIDTPLYYSVHSQWAQLTPKGGALIHVARYGGGEAAELETLLDEMQPGWRAVLVHRRFLPSMIVSNAVPAATITRPPVHTPIEGLFLAGDWVGGEGMLSDAALASARATSKAILTT